MPGLIRGVARTAVVAGTASAVSGRVQRRQAEKYADRDAQIAAERNAAYQQQVAPQQWAVRTPTSRPGHRRRRAAQVAGGAEGPGHPHGGGVRRPEGEDPRQLTPVGTEDPGGTMTERLPRVALVLLVSASLVVTLAGLRATADIVGPTFLALVLTITVHPVRRGWCAGGCPSGWSRSSCCCRWSTCSCSGSPSAWSIAIGRLAALVPTYIPDVEESLADAGDRLADLGVGEDQVQAVVGAFDFGNLLSLASDIFGAAVGVLSNLVFIVTLALFMAFDTGAIQRVFERVREVKPDLVDALASFAKGTRTYMAVSAGFGLIVAVIDGVALQLMGVPGAFVWAVLAFVTNFIPNIGFVIGVIPPALIGLLEGGPGLMVGVLAVYCVINLIIQSIIQPRYVGDAVGLTRPSRCSPWSSGPGCSGRSARSSRCLSACSMRALLIEADPAAAWAMPLISGHAPEPDADDRAARGLTGPRRRAVTDERGCGAAR